MENIYKNAKIVVIDDVEEVLNSTKNCLEFEDMNVECFNSPIVGLEYLKHNKVDVLLLDYYMPEMNGDEFVSKLRDFNNETIVILRTGYADKIPPMEMMDRLNIQGYIDKLKGNEELILITKSAIKMANLYKENAEQKTIIESRSYQNEFFGKFLQRLMYEIQERGFLISASSKVLEQYEKEIPEKEKNNYIKAVNGVSNGIMKLEELIDSLIYEEKMISVNDIIKTINILFNNLIKENKIKFEIENKVESQYQILQCTPKYLLYIIVDVIEYCLYNKIPVFNMQVAKKDWNDYVEFKINKVNFDSQIKHKVLKLADLDERIKIELKEYEIDIKIM